MGAWWLSAQVLGSGCVLAELLLLQALGMERVPGLVDIAGELATQNKQSACVTSVKGDSRKLQVPLLGAPTRCPLTTCFDAPYFSSCDTSWCRGACQLVGVRCERGCLGW